MTDIRDAFAGMVDAIIADNAITRAEAGDVIETYGPTMAGSEARNWIDAVAVEWESLGVINQDTWASLRSHVISEGKASVENLFDAVINRINELTETTEVANAIQEESLTQEAATIPGNIALIEGFKTTDEQLNEALDQGIFALQTRLAEINQQLGN